MKRITFKEQAKVPDAELLAMLPDSIAKVAAETATLRGRYEKGIRDLVESEHERDAARIADAENAAVSIREGKPSPRPSLLKMQAKVDAQVQPLEAVGRAAQAAGVDLRKAVEAHRESAIATLREQQSKERDACHRAALALAAAVAEGGTTAALIGWLKEPNHGPSATAYTRRETKLVGMNGDPLTTDRLIGELTSAFLPEEQVTNPHQVR